MIEVEIAAILSHLTFTTLLLVLVGVIIGVTVGSVPGLSGSIAMATALPFTVIMGPVAALSLLIGIYKGSMFGGAISAIVFGVPGTASSAPTVFDGYPMAQQGRPFKAMKTALWSGVAADTASDIVLVLTFAPLALVALSFGPRELFGLLLIAVAILAVFASDSIGKAVIAIAIGLFLSSMGSDPMIGLPRNDFGIAGLREGVDLIPLLVGLFATTEVMVQFGQLRKDRRARRESQRVGDKPMEQPAIERRDDDTLGFREWLTYWREVSLGAVIGTVVGALPGPGGVLASFSSYGLAGQFKKNRGRWGTGVPEGVAAAESADSATSGATFIPLFGLGIPGSAAAALFAAALLLQGISPGPTMLRRDTDVVYAFFVFLFIASIANLLVTNLLLPIYVRLAAIPAKILVPTLSVLTVLGVYSVQNSLFAVIVMVGAGFLGLFMRRHGIPIGALLMAYIMGPLVESNLRRGGLIASGDVLYWFSSGLAITFYVGGAIVLGILLRQRRKLSKERKATATGEVMD